MKNMKKTLALVALTAILAMTSCNGGATEADATKSDSTAKAVTIDSTLLDTVAKAKIDTLAKDSVKK